MTPALLTLGEAGEYLRCRDRRTARKRLAELGVPLIPAGRSVLVRRADLEQAITAAACPGRPPGQPGAGPAGVTLPPGVRLGTPEAGAHLQGRGAGARLPRTWRNPASGPS